MRFLRRAYFADVASDVAGGDQAVSGDVALTEAGVTAGKESPGVVDGGGSSEAIGSPPMAFLRDRRRAVRDFLDRLSGNDLAAVLAAMHLPSGRIALKQLPRLSVIEFSVQLLREDWPKCSTPLRSVFEEWRTWLRAPRE